MSGRRDGRTLRIEEYLLDESGEAHHRTFRIEKINDDNYTAKCAEFVGFSAIRRHQFGFQWRYHLKERSKEAHSITLAADDRLFLCGDGTILDHAILKKLGIRVGDVFMTLRQARLVVN